MSNFKISKKQALSDNRTTLIDLHDKKMQSFELEKLEIPKIQNELILLKIELLNNNNKQSIILLKEKINILNEKLELIESDNNRINYLLDFMNIAKKIDNNNNNQINNNQINNNQINNQINSLDYFINSTVDNSKAELYNEYIKKFNPGVDKIPIIKNNENVCILCKSTDFIIDYRQSYEICSKCGKTDELLILPNINSNIYNEDLEQFNSFEYKRKNHFLECLNQLQAKENTTIPDKIINDLTIEFKKYNIINPKILTPKLVKSYLKKLNYSKYYEHIPTIINQFCGIKAPKMTPELEEQLKIMFDEIQEPFKRSSQVITPERKNFLNYNYIFYKMCQLLNKDEFLIYFPLLKSREKLYEHDLIWKNICNELRWQFIPSI